MVTLILHPKTHSTLSNIIEWGGGDRTRGTGGGDRVQGVRDRGAKTPGRERKGGERRGEGGGQGSGVIMFQVWKNRTG